MTLAANLPPPSATARPRAAHRSSRARRWRSFHLRRRQADDHVVAFVHATVHDLCEVTVGDAWANPHAFRFLRGRIEDVDRLSTAPSASATALERAARASDAWTASGLRHAPFRI